MSRRAHTKNEISLPNGITNWFDAIDNTATGVHSSSTETWTDKVGGMTVNKVSGKTVSWGDNYFYGSEYFTSANGQSFGLGTSDFTLIAIADIKSSSSEYLIGETYYSNPGNYRWYISDGYDGTTMELTQYYNNTWNHNLLNFTPQTTHIGETVAIIVTRSGNTLKLYINGELKNTITNFTNPLQSTQPKIAIGGRAVKTYGCMVYKRCLSDDEVVQVCDFSRNYYSVTLNEID